MIYRNFHKSLFTVLAALLLAPLLLTAGPAAGEIAPCAVLDVYNHPDSGTDIKAKRIINGNEVTQVRLSPGDREFVTVGAANEVWTIRRVNDASKVWQGPAQCSDELIVVGGDTDNDAPTISFDDIPIQPTPIIVSGTVSDDSNIVEVKAAIRELGTTTYYRPDGSTSSWHRLDLNGQGGSPLVNWSTPAMNLPDNTYEIIVRATDEHGNRSSWVGEAFVVRGDVDADTPPTITVLSLQPNDVLVAGSASFTGTAVDINNLSDVKATIMNVDTNEFLRLDGTFGQWQRMEVDWDPDEALWTTVPVDLPQGNYLFSVKAVDGIGNASQWLDTPFQVSAPVGGDCIITMVNATDANMTIRVDGTNRFTVAPGSSQPVIVSAGERLQVRNTIVAIWEWENTPVGQVPAGCTDRTVTVDGTCAAATIVNNAPEDIKLRENNGAGEQTIAVIAPGDSITVDRALTQRIILRRPSDSEKLMDRNPGACGDVTFTVEAAWNISIDFGF